MPGVYMPFDGTTATIGEAAVLNENGGAVAFFGTTRTVYAQYNKVLNMSEGSQKIALSGALSLYLERINLFIPYTTIKIIPVLRNTCQIDDTKH